MAFFSQNNRKQTYLAKPIGINCKIIDYYIIVEKKQECLSNLSSEGKGKILN